MVTLVDITAGSISFATNADFLDGNRTAAEVLANALQVRHVHLSSLLWLVADSFCLFECDFRAVARAGARAYPCW